MNILPLVLVVLLILSALTVENMERYKSHRALDEHYRTYLMESERQSFNDRQSKLKKRQDARSQRQLSFTYFFDKNLREKNEEKAKQMRLITVELIKELYGEAAFYKELESKRSNFVEEMLDEFIASADALEEKDKIKRIEDIQRVRLASPDLQDAFYRMLKGTMVKKEKKVEEKKKEEKEEPMTARDKEKGYYSLLTFLKHQDNPSISIHLASRELLKAIYGNQDIVNAILQRRKELKKNSKEGSSQFKEEFQGKQRPEIKDDLLEIKITSSIHSYYD